MIRVSKNTPPERKPQRNISFWNIKSGDGEQFLLQDCRAKADAKGVICSQTPVYKRETESNSSKRERERDLCLCMYIYIYIYIHTYIEREREREIDLCVNCFIQTPVCRARAWSAPWGSRRAPCAASSWCRCVYTCMYTCVYIYIYIYYIYTYRYSYIHTCMYVFTYIQVCKYIYIYIYTYVY